MGVAMMGPEQRARFIRHFRQKRQEYLDRALLAEFRALAAEAEAFKDALDRKMEREEDYWEWRAAVDRERRARDG